ncbi:polymer-forming cytoskeletal protein [bacterium]|nr:polymer-forming cytoskeletal protein [bacterium]
MKLGFGKTNDTLKRWHAAALQGTSSDSSFDDDVVLLTGKQTENASEVGATIDLDFSDQAQSSSRTSAQTDMFTQRQTSYAQPTFSTQQSTTYSSGTSASSGSLAQSFAKVPTSDPSLTLEDDLQRRFGTHIRAAIGTGTVIEGKLSFDSPVRVEGTLHGEVTSPSALIVGSHGIVDAKVRVGTLIVLGTVTGDIQVEDLIEIRRGGRLDADITVKRLVIEDGGAFNGYCNLSK